MFGTPPLTVVFRRHPRARRLTLRITPTDVVLTLPPKLAKKEAIAFLERQEPWLRKKLADRPARRSLSSAQSIPFLGEERRITAGTGRALRLGPGTLEVPGPESQRAARIRAFLRNEARIQLTEASDTYARQIGRRFGRITLRDTRSRWGSCSSDGNLMYSWRLIMAPREVLRYVAAHEVAHLIEMNHAPEFWAIVARIMPDYHQHRDWLRRNGAELQSIDLGA